jgi:hypothetical protein
MSSFCSVSPLVIDDSVGRDGKNLPFDVRTVQWLINGKLPAPLRPLDITGICDWLTISAIETYQRHILRMASPSGKIEPGDATLQSLKEVIQKPGRKYTAHANEAPVKKTTPELRDVVNELLAGWPELYPPGARTLAAQYLAETGGTNCYNWNLGNKKSGVDNPHMYLNPVPECYSKSAADAFVAKGKGLARLATADEMKKWTCADTMVVFIAPHEQCRFRAYSSLKEGVLDWLALHKQRASSNRDYMKALQAGDTAGAAKALKKAQYYTAPEDKYAQSMAAQRKVVDAKLGPLPPPWK